jgi:hypothetical protein
MLLARDNPLFCHNSVVDVGSEWRTFNNEKSVSDPSRVGAAQVSKTPKKLVRNAFVKIVLFTLHISFLGEIRTQA